MTELINTKIAGVSFRQEEVKKLKEGQELILEREPNNKFDSNAIKVLSQEKKELGYINKVLVEQISPKLDEGAIVKCTITKLTGADYQNRGINILLEFN